MLISRRNQHLALSESSNLSSERPTRAPPFVFQRAFVIEACRAAELSRLRRRGARGSGRNLLRRRLCEINCVCSCRFDGNRSLTINLRAVLHPGSAHRIRIELAECKYRRDKKALQAPLFRRLILNPDLGSCIGYANDQPYLAAVRD